MQRVCLVCYPLGKTTEAVKGTCTHQFIGVYNIQGVNFLVTHRMYENRTGSENRMLKKRYRQPSSDYCTTPVCLFNQMKASQDRLSS